MSIGPEFPWYLRQTKEGLPAAVSAYCNPRQERPWLVLDFETTNKDKGWAGNPHNHIVCASSEFLINPEGGTEPLTEYGTEYGLPGLAARLNYVKEQRGVLVAHGAKFEAGWLERMGFDPSDFLWWDTLLAEYVEAGNRPWKLNLDEMAQRYGRPSKDPLVDRLIKNGVSPADIDIAAITARNAKDVEDCAHIAMMQIENMDERKKRLVFTRCLSIPVLARVEQEGVRVDAERVEGAVAAAEAELKVLNQQWEDFQRRHLRQLRKPEWLLKEISLTNSDHVAWVLYKALGAKELKNARGEVRRNKATKRWPTGKPLANDKAISKLKLEDEAQREFVKLRKDMARVKSELSKTLYFYQGVCQLHGGVFFGQYNQSVTATHRLSSSGRKVPMPDGKLRGVQLQNQPRKYLGLMCAKNEDDQLASADAAQLEFRTAVELGDDSAGRANISKGVDQHMETAKVIFKTAEPTKDQRQDAKPHTFKPLYGGRKGTEAEMRYYEAFRTWFPGIAAAQEGWTEEVLQTDKLELPWGMTFYWPNTKISKDGYIDNTPSIYNYPIQSLATAEIVPVAVVYTYYRMRRMFGKTARMVNMVHDSAIAEIPRTTDATKTWVNICRLTFGRDVYTYLACVYNMEFATTLGLGVKAELLAKEEKFELPYEIAVLTVP